MPFTSVSVRRSESHGDGGKRVRRRRAEASHSQFALRRTGAGSKRVPTAARSRDLRDRQRWRDCRSPAVPASALQPAVVLPAAGPSYRDASGCPRRLRRTAAPAAAPPPASLSAISPTNARSPDRHLADEKYVASSLFLGFSNGYVATLGERRTYGLTVSFKF